MDGDLHAIATQLDLYRKLTGDLPTTKQGILALVKPPEEPPRSWRAFLKEVPQDPWGRPYQYVASPDKSRGYDLFSFGPDRTTAADDIHFE